MDKVPVICGGYIYLDDCINVTANKAVLLGKMKKEREFAASVVLNNSVLWVTGGKNVRGFLSSTEFIHLNGTISYGNSGYRSLKLHTQNNHIIFKVL